MHHELAGEKRRFMPKPVVDNVRFFAAIDDDRMFPSRRGAKSGRQRVEGSFEHGHTSLASSLFVENVRPPSDDEAMNTSRLLSM